MTDCSIYKNNKLKKVNGRCSTIIRKIKRFVHVFLHLLLQYRFIYRTELISRTLDLINFILL